MQEKRARPIREPARREGAKRERSLGGGADARDRDTRDRDRGDRAAAKARKPRRGTTGDSRRGTTGDVVVRNVGDPRVAAAGDEELWRLERALIGVIRALGQLSLPASVGPIEKAGQMVLGRAEELGPSRLTDLAAHIGLDNSTVSRQVHKLVDAGLMEQGRDPLDKRACTIQVTSEGREALSSIRSSRQEQLSELLGGWPPADRRECVRLLEQLADDLQPHPRPRLLGWRDGGAR